MTSRVDKLSIKVGGLDNKVDNLSTQVDGFSTKLEEFASNLTDFTKITNTNSANITKVSKDLKDTTGKTDKNSETIFTLIDMLKGHGLKLRDVESELTDINETVDERFEKVSEKLKTLSKNDKQILKVLTGNSGNIERLFNKIKGKGRDSGGGGEVREVSLVQSESEFKEDEEPTARMMELVSSFPINNVWTGLYITLSGEFLVLNHTTKPGLQLYDKDGVLLRQLNDSDVKFGQLIYGLQQDSRVVINGDKIFIKMPYVYGTLPEINVFNTEGRYIETIKGKSISNNGILYSLFMPSPNDTSFTHVGKYPKGYEDGQFISNYHTKNVVISKNGDVFVGDNCGNKQQSFCRIQVFDSDGTFKRKFPIRDNLYNKFNFKNIVFMNIFEDELFVQFGEPYQYIHVYNLDGKFLYKFNQGKEYRNGSLVNTSLQSFQITPSGDVCMWVRENNPEYLKHYIYIYKRSYQYVQRPLERKYKIYPHSQVEKDLEKLQDKKVLSVWFPLSIYQNNSPYFYVQPSLWNGRDTDSNLVTHTIYFQKPQSVKKAVQAVEEYFNGPLTKSDFQDLQSGCLFGYIEGRFASRELNWETCNYNRLCRGYFLGGNVLSGISIRDETELVLDITQD